MLLIYGNRENLDYLTNFTFADERCTSLFETLNSNLFTALFVEVTLLVYIMVVKIEDALLGPVDLNYSYFIFFGSTLCGNMSLCVILVTSICLNLTCLYI